MSSTPTPPEPTDPATQRAEDAQYYRQVLHKFIAMGTDLAEAVHRQATEQPAASTSSPTPQHAITFDRLARSVRRTIVLTRKLSEPDRDPPGPKPHPKGCYADGWDERGLSARQRSTDCAEGDAEYAEPYERPEEPDDDLPEDDDEDLDEQDMAYLMASIGNDLNRAARSDADLLKRRTPQERRQGVVSGDRCPCAARPRHPEPARSHAGTHDPVAAPPAHPGTGPPDP